LKVKIYALINLFSTRFILEKLLSLFVVYQQE